jgi:Uri superfamily endonuclease
MENLGKICIDSENTVTVYGIRRLSRKGYIYVGSTVLPLESRIRRHIMDSIKKRHSNKQLSAIIRESKNMIIADVLDVCSIDNRAEIELFYIMKIWNNGNKLTNITNPVNPREKLPFKKGK